MYRAGRACLQAKVLYSPGNGESQVSTRGSGNLHSPSLLAMPMCFVRLQSG
jgi:hypothetical protein